jgi:hypothetical protein
VKAKPKNTLKRIDRAAIRRYLRAGLTPTQYRPASPIVPGRMSFLTEEEAKLEGTFRSIVPSLG